MLQAVQERLNQSKGAWKRIADTIPMPYGTLRKIADGKTKNPRFENVQTLYNYFYPPRSAQQHEDAA